MKNNENAFKIIDGWIEIICGPVFSGKSEELIKKINRFRYASVDCLVFKPKIDTHNGTLIRSRSGKEIKAIEIDSPSEIYNYVKKDLEIPCVFAIDEVQFLDESVIEVIQVLTALKINFLLSGLDQNFRGEPFKQMATLLAMADRVHKLTAICSVCGGEAVKTQRLINDIPANYNSELILFGDDFYAPRCRLHHVVPGKPLDKIIEKYKSNIDTK